MNIFSRTPEGECNRCAICGNEIRITPSEPSGDAPCPHCGVLLWFVRDDIGIWFRKAAPSAPRPQRSPEYIRNLLAPIHAGDRVRIVEGTFEAFEGKVDTIDRNAGQVQVTIQIYGREAPVDLEWWQVRRIPD